MKSSSKLTGVSLLFIVGFLSAVLIEISFSTTKFWGSTKNKDLALQRSRAAPHLERFHNNLNLTRDETAEMFASSKYMQNGAKEKNQQAEIIRPIVTNMTFLTSRLPQRPLEERSIKDERILVVYSGPTDVMDPEFPLSSYTRGHKKIELYRLNFEFFLKHGVQCKTQDTILVVTDLVAPLYRSRVDTLHKQCQVHGNSVILATRNNTCLDLESVRVALYGGYVNVSTYDYFVYVNCGVTGPSPQWANLPWTNLFLSKLNEKIRMTGLSMNCRSFIPHIQSMMYAMDRTALQLVMEGGAIFNCESKAAGSSKKQSKSTLHGIIVNGYERRMSQLIMQSGYGISPILRPLVIFSHNVTQCKDGNESQKDLWLTWRLKDYFGKVPTLDEVVFFKTSRILVPETAEQINFTMKVDWNW